MKKFKLSLMLIFMSMLVFSACGGGSGGGSDDPKDPTATLEINGDTYTYTLLGGTVFNAILTPDIATTKTFPCNIDADYSYDEATDVANVPARFIIGETEVTYQLWKEVYDWATSIERGSEKYTFANVGKMGYYNGSGNTNRHPVTWINWRDTIVWCNALTEYYNANNGTAADIETVYYSDANYRTPLRTSTDSELITYTTAGSQDNPYIYASSKGNTDMANCSAKGFRLPTSIEWEYAARYRGNDSTNTVSGYTNPYYTQGDSASGATADYNDVSATSVVAVYGVSSTASVKTKTANALGLYDMSGNVFEWCFDWHPNYNGLNSVDFLRVRQGGCFVSHIFLQVGHVGICDENGSKVHDYSCGFRFCRSK